MHQFFVPQNPSFHLLEKRLSWKLSSYLVLVMFQWFYHLHIMSLYAYNQDLAVDIKQSNFFK